MSEKIADITLPGGTKGALNAKETPNGLNIYNTNIALESGTIVPIDTVDALIQRLQNYKKEHSE